MSRRPRLLLPLLASAAISAGAASARAQDSTLAIVDVTVLAMDGGGLRPHQTLLVRHGHIAAIGDAARVAIPSGTRRIDPPPGSVLLPGLTDAHVHLEAAPAGWMGAFVAAGVTSVFNLRGTTDHLALRSRVQDGTLIGPRIYSSGGYANLPLVQSAGDADSLVRTQRAEGFDFVKIHGSLAPAAYSALDSAARREGVALIGHLPRNLPFDSILARRQVMIAHAEELLYTALAARRDSAAVQATAGQLAAHGSWLTPTLAIYKAIGDQVGRPAVVDSALALPGLVLTAELRRLWGSGIYTNRAASQQPAFRASLETLRALTRAAHRAGVPLLAGTDTPLPRVAPGASLHDELDELVAAGLTREEALLTATRRPSEFLRQHTSRTERFGEIAEGAIADLLLVAGDPRRDLRVLRHPIGVAVMGRWYDRPALDAHRDAVSRR
jgi:imidazolonepropionase-like amidohydrolase